LISQKITNEIVIREAKAIGFDLIGFVRADRLETEVDHLKDWLDLKYQAGMSYMERNFDKRKDVKQILPDAESVISLGLNYYSKEKYSKENSKGKISRYAWGTDYHIIIKKMLNELEERLKIIDPEFQSISYVDTGPVMDKAWAVKAGIGWLGKHTNVINREIGSWFFIANIITNIEFDYTSPIQDYCGSCTACLDACPTNAIVKEYVVDSNKCISYLTIENKGEIPEKFKDDFNDWLFGCDICQDVCPWNQKFPAETSIQEFHLREKNKELELDEVIEMDENEFNLRFKDSAVKRTKLKGLKRNARFLLNKSDS